MSETNTITETEDTTWPRFASWWRGRNEGREPHRDDPQTKEQYQFYCAGQLDARCETWPVVPMTGMKYVLLEHADGNDPKQLRLFDTVDARARATREAILGAPSADNKDTPCPELLELAANGIVDFEGEPSLEWFCADVS